VQKGHSLNPAGRPPGRKDQITELKQDLELAVRQHLKPAKVKEVIDKLVELAVQGNTRAIGILLDKVLPSAKDTDDSDNKLPNIRIVIENATFRAQSPSPPTEAIEAEYVEVTSSEQGTEPAP